jgi:predicted transcriptional regulator
MGLWAKSVVIFNAIREHGKQSIRRLADRTGLSKSRVHRHLQAIDRRDRYPESSLWETEAGRAWLIRLVVATLFVFGLKRGVGAETLSEFFRRLRLEAHVGCSPSALRTVMHLLERLLLDTAAAWEKDGIAHGEIRPVIGAVDETFLQRLMLVFMDLATGYLLMEEVATDRSFATWFDRANDRLTTFGTEVLYLVSDRAKALIKLAHTGLGCPSIPDLFHLGHDLAKGYALAIFGRLRQAKQALDQAKQHLKSLPTSQADRDQLQKAQACVEACETAVKHWQGVGSTWRQHLSNVSRIMHPWRLVDSTRQTSKEVECQLHAEVQALETLLETNGLPVKKDILDKVRKQLAGLAALVDVWWQTVHQDLTQLAMTPRWTQWADELLLPLMYWHAPGNSQLRCWRAGKRGRLSTRGRSSGHHRRLKDATAISRRCSTTIAACPHVATRCGRRCITSIVGPRMGRHRHHGFSGGRFPICLKACCHRSTRCPCPGNVVKPSRQVIEEAGCPGLSGSPEAPPSDRRLSGAE